MPDHTADINLTYSTIARDYLLREGMPPDQVIKTGSPMYEVLHHYLPQIQRSDAVARGADPNSGPAGPTSLAGSEFPRARPTVPMLTATPAAMLVLGRS